MSPFLTLRNHPDLAVHVHHIDIYSPPFIAVGQVHPSFLSETADALKVCKNLTSFVCSQKILPALLVSLEGKERLEDVHILAAFTTTQGEMLQKITTLRSLTLDYPTWNVIDSLPRWAQSLQRTLVHLTIYVRYFCRLQQPTNVCLDVSRSEWRSVRSLASDVTSSSRVARHWMSKGFSFGSLQSCRGARPVVEGTIFHYICMSFV